MASVHSCHTASYIVHLSEIARCGRFTLATHAFFMAREATGAQEDASSKPRRRFARPLRPDLSLTTQKKCRFVPNVVPCHQLPPSGVSVGNVFFLQEHSLQPCRSHTRRFALDA